MGLTETKKIGFDVYSCKDFDEQIVIDFLKQN